MKLTNEQLLAVKRAESTAELSELLRKYGQEVSEEDVNKLFAYTRNTGELTDEELDHVAGGFCLFEGDEFPELACPQCGHVGMQERFDIGFSDLWYIVCQSCNAAFTRSEDGSLVYHPSIDCL